MMAKNQKAANEEMRKDQTNLEDVVENTVTEDIVDENSFDTELRAKATEIPVEIETEEVGAEPKKNDEDLSQKYLDQLQLLQAEFQNYKKRVEREKNEISRYVKGEFIRKLLPVIDDLARSVKNHEADLEFEGFRLINEKLMQILKEEGLEEVFATGNVFDPNYHDALYTQEVEDAEADGKVLEEWEKGYFFQGTLIRPSKVKVGKKKE